MITMTTFSVGDPLDGEPDLAPDDPLAQLRVAPDDAEWYCGRCVYFETPPAAGARAGTCVVVTGPIGPRQVCNQFQRRPEPTEFDELPQTPAAGGEQIVQPVEVGESEESEPEEEPEVVEASGRIEHWDAYFLTASGHSDDDKDDDRLPSDTAVMVVAVEGVKTADNRIVMEGALTWRDTPLSVTRNHDPDQIVGKLTVVARATDEQVAALQAIIDERGEVTVDEFKANTGAEGDSILGFTVFDLEHDEGLQAAKQVEGGFLRGVSMEVGDEEITFECLEEDDDGFCLVDLMRLHAGRIGAVTLAPFQAIEPARVLSEHEDDEDDDDIGYAAVAAGSFAVIGQADLPLADFDRDWDGDEARQRMAVLCSSDGSGDTDTIDFGCFSRGFFLRREDADPETVGAYSLPFADVVNDRLQAVPRGIFAVAAALAGGRGGVEGLSGDERDLLDGRICAYYDRMRERDSEIPDCPLRSEGATTAASSRRWGRWAFVPRRKILIASGAAAPERFDAGWFENPGFGESTEFTLTDDLQFYGHAAQWDVCHIGITDSCILAPHSRSGYAYYVKPNVSHLASREGTGVPVPAGIVTFATGHASLRANPQRTIRHYDDTGTQGGYVNIGEDEHGIWMAGAARRGLTDDEYIQMAASYISGDWRKINLDLELVALLCVNTPGYPTARAHVSSGAQISLVSAGVVPKGLHTVSAEGCSCGSDHRMESRVAALEEVAADSLAASIHPER